VQSFENQLGRKMEINRWFFNQLPSKAVWIIFACANPLVQNVAPVQCINVALGQEQNQNICQKNQSAVQIQFILKEKLNPNRSERWNKTNKHQLLGYLDFSVGQFYLLC
jgi:hypothetical protein